MPAPASAALVIFARHPYGRVKTRLVPPLTPAQALALHVACLKSTARLAASLPARVDAWLYLSSPNLAAARRAARRLRLSPALRLRVQGDGRLGQRLARAFSQLLSAGYHRVVIIGTDSPALSPQRLRQAFRVLRRFDAVLAPARDGGFYLIGLRAPQAGLHKLCDEIEWGSSRACRQMQRRLLQAQRRLQLLPVGYDVDRPGDLNRLRLDLRRPRPHLQPLRDWFARHRG